MAINAQYNMENEITLALKAVKNGDTNAKNNLAEMVYGKLKSIAANKLMNESWQNTLTVTFLAHEAFLKVDQTTQIHWQNRQHYYGAIAEAMRRILVDRARYHSRKRREGSKNSISIDDKGLNLIDIQPEELVWLSDTLDDLEQVDTELVNIIRFKFFIGLTNKEIADTMGVSVRTIDRRWEAARAWLIIEKKTR